MRKTKKLIATALVATSMLSAVYSVYGASVREAWNNAAGSKTDGTVLMDGTTVYSNVYADATKWNAWKTTWNDIRTDFEQIALTPGTDATELNFAWYSHTQETSAIRLTDKEGNPTGYTAYGSQGTDTETLSGVVYYPNKVTLTGLEEETTYYYQYLANGVWSDTYTYKTQNTTSFSALYVGDPQIGASTGQTASESNEFANSKEYFARNDAYNWNETLTNALTANPNVSFLLSAGDQINQTSASKDADKLQQQVEYAGFLYPSVLRSLPLATTIGNHDSQSVNYKNHFNNPNTYTEEVGASTAGNDYYFTYGNTLFVSINTNNMNCQTHKDLIEKAISENPDVTWKVLMFHQDIYGSGLDHSDSDGMILRTQLTSIIDDAGFDAVLQGHDHTYSRTYQLSAADGTFTNYDGSNYRDDNTTYQAENTTCYNLITGESEGNKVINPLGTVYFEANSSTGSKFYQLIGTQQDYIAARSQSWRPTYSVIEIDEVSLTVKTYDAATNEELVADGDVATSYTIVKEVNKDNLLNKLTEAKELLAKTDIYTTDSLSALESVINAAEVIYNNSEAYSIDVASAYTSLAEAMTSLVEIEEESKSNTQTPDVKANNTNVVTSPVTGDTSTVVFTALIAVVSMGAFVVMMIDEKKKVRKNENTAQ